MCLQPNYKQWRVYIKEKKTEKIICFFFKNILFKI